MYVPIFKKGDAKECNKYRTIALTFPHKQNDATKASTSYRARNAGCSNWTQKRKRHWRTNGLCWIRKCSREFQVSLFHRPADPWTLGILKSYDCFERNGHVPALDCWKYPALWTGATVWREYAKVSDEVAFYLPICLICTQTWHLKTWARLRKRRSENRCKKYQ